MTCVSCWISHIPAKMRGWWICLPSRAICIVHYAARLDPCAWMGMGNWTRPGASSIQLLSLGRRSSTESGLKSASDTWRYQLCFSANWEIWSPEATGTHGYVCVCVCVVMCVFFSEREGRSDWLQSLCLCVMLWSAVCVCASMWSMRLCWPRQWGVCVNNRALVSTTNPARDWWRWITELGALQRWIRGWAGSRDSVHQYAVNYAPLSTSETGRRLRSPSDMMDKGIDSAASAGHLDLRRDSALMQYPI